MTGTKAGGIKAAKTNKERHGEDFFRRIGQEGGRNGNTGGFAANPELARIAGKKGGRVSRRNSIHSLRWEKNKDEILSMYYQGVPMTKISKKVGIPYQTITYKIRRIRNEME